MLLPLPADRTSPKRPWAMFGLVGLTAAVSLLQLEAVTSPGTMGWELQREGFAPLQLVSHLLLHGSPGHLLGNMAFLVAVGYHLNPRMGHLRFLLSYLVLGVAAGGAWLAWGGGTAAIGASGAVMGMVGLYLVLLPTLRVRFLVWWPLYALGVLALVWTHFDLPGGFPLLPLAFVYAVIAVGLAHREYSTVGGSFLQVPMALIGFATISMTGLWVVGLTVGADVLYLLSDLPTNVAHEAHLGGACAGFALGVTLCAVGLVRGTHDQPTALEVIGLRRMPPVPHRTHPASVVRRKDTTRRRRRTSPMSYSQWENQTRRLRQAGGRPLREKPFRAMAPQAK